MTDQPGSVTHLSDKRGGDSFERVRGEVDRVLNELDVRGIAQKLRELGRERPMTLAFVALTVGLASGLLIRDGISKWSPRPE